MNPRSSSLMPLPPHGPPRVCSTARAPSLMRASPVRIVVEMVRTCASAWISPSRHSNDRGSLWAAGPGRMTTLQAS